MFQRSKLGHRHKSDQTCPLCREELGLLDLWVCDGCSTTYHDACFVELGGCATLGCPQVGQSPPRGNPERSRLSAMRAEAARLAAERTYRGLGMAGVFFGPILWGVLAVAAQALLWENWEPNPLWFLVIVTLGFFPMGFVGFWLEKLLMDRRIARLAEPIRDPKGDESKVDGGS
jgi:hypothetical protein